MILWVCKISANIYAICKLFHQDIYVLQVISVILGSFSGLFIAIARLANRSLLKEIYITLFVKRSSLTWTSFRASTISKDLRMPLDTTKDTMSDKYLYYSEIYDHITKHVIYIQSMLEILITIAIKFIKDDTPLPESLQ
jgi:hypothetical protein